LWVFDWKEKQTMVDQSTKTAVALSGKSDDLPSLFGRLIDDVGKLFDAKLMLLKVEIREDVDSYIRGSFIIATGAIVAAIGFALINIALAFILSTLFANTSLSQPAKYALGFVLTGLAYVVIGSIAIVIAKNRLGRQGIMPRRTIAELERDKEWIESEL